MAVMMLESPREIQLNRVEKPQDQCQVFFLVNGKVRVGDIYCRSFL